MTGTVRVPGWVDVALSLSAFWLPSAGIISYLIWREVRRLRREVRDLKLDAEASAAEGYPPPDPPTTDQPPAQGVD